MYIKQIHFRYKNRFISIREELTMKTQNFEVLPAVVVLVNFEVLPAGVVALHAKFNSCSHKHSYARVLSLRV